MHRQAAALVFVLTSLAYAIIIDRIAIIIGNSIIKDSDIERDIRVTSFLNGVPVNLNAGSRKAAANRLIDQVFIRREIREGEYPAAGMQDAERQLLRLRQEKYQTDAAYERALHAYGITDLDVRAEFQWQLTVLRFIDLRFKPAVLVTDTEVETYYRAHLAALRHEHPGDASLTDVKAEIQNIVTGERVNQEFFSWLDEQRKNTKIKYLEDGLR